MDIGYNIIARNEDEDNEEIYFLTDMQGKYPETFEEVPDYDWCRAEDINW